MNKRLQKGFGQAGNEVMRNPELSFPAKALYAYLCTYADAETNLTYVGLNRMCAELDVTRSTIKRNMSILTKAGVVSRFIERGRWYTKILK